MAKPDMGTANANIFTLFGQSRYVITINTHFSALKRPNSWQSAVLRRHGGAAYINARYIPCRNATMVEIEFWLLWVPSICGRYLIHCYETIESHEYLAKGLLHFQYDFRILSHAPSSFHTLLLLTAISTDLLSKLRSPVIAVRNCCSKGLW